MPNLYFIAGPNGSGKTTAAFTFLPEILHVKHFVNADEIARGIYTITPAVIMSLLLNMLILAKQSLTLIAIIVYLTMISRNTPGDLSEKMRIGFEKARLKLLEQEAKNNGIIVISDKDGNIKEIPAKELLSTPKDAKNTK